MPLAIDLSVTDVESPLSQFQTKAATAEGLWAIATAVNAAAGDRGIDPGRLRTLFDKFWSELEAAIAAAQPSGEQPAESHRSERALLEEVVSTVRQLAANQSRPLEPRAVTRVAAAIMREQSDVLHNQNAVVDWKGRLLPYGTASIRIDEDGMISVRAPEPVPLGLQAELAAGLRGRARTMVKFMPGSSH